MDWRTYTPDGRALTVKRRGRRWLARCGSKEAASEALTEAIRDALGYDRDEALATATTPAQLERWIADRAAEIEADERRERGED